MTDLETILQTIDMLPEDAIAQVAALVSADDDFHHTRKLAHNPLNVFKFSQGTSLFQIQTKDGYHFVLPSFMMVLIRAAQSDFRPLTTAVNLCYSQDIV